MESDPAKYSACHPNLGVRKIPTADATMPPVAHPKAQLHVENVFANRRGAYSFTYVTPIGKSAPSPIPVRNRNPQNNQKEFAKTAVARLKIVATHRAASNTARRP